MIGQPVSAKLTGKMFIYFEILRIQSVRFLRYGAYQVLHDQEILSTCQLYSVCKSRQDLLGMQYQAIVCNVIM